MHTFSITSTELTFSFSPAKKFADQKFINFIVKLYKCFRCAYLSITSTDLEITFSFSQAKKFADQKSIMLFTLDRLS